MQQLEVLEDDTHLSAESWDTAPFDVGHFLAQNNGLLGILTVNVQFTVDGFQQRALTRSDTSDEIDELSLFGLKVYIFQNQAFVLIYVYFLIVYQHDPSCMVL